MSSANVLEVVEFQAGLLCSYRVEKINPIPGADYGFRWLLLSVPFPIYFNKFLHVLSFLLFRSNAMRYVQ
jgi:hypothetical protein